ncbi:MAG TPA: DUF3570 domain-containing protein [Salinimicrobium catena]|uniref:DUF3570 domain-containing protein n=1 Tax=Salinimicrobium catena TaxID=390640 RepID=A0A7C2RE43_9FLAO|nr:DUF3570 domain-containing protein [Salinimicrobium catena]
MRILISIVLLLFVVTGASFAQEGPETGEETFKKRVLENTEIDLLAGYYSQDGENAAVTGGRGTEELTDIAPTIVVSIPMNEDDVLTIDAGISAYTSASSSNVDPFDGKGPADPFTASSGASASDVYANFTGTYSHSSDDRNKIWTAKLSVSTEYDYFSAGVGGSYTRLFNEKNTELSFNANIYLDTWNAIYPYELRPFGEGGNGLNNNLFNRIVGNEPYAPSFTEFDGETRNSYSVGLNFSQILSKKIQGSLALDLVQQEGLLSTPFQRVYFSDKPDVFIENFHLADDVERLPDTRFKIAAGGRLNFYLNEIFVIRSYYRFYTDDWGILSNTASVEVPVKISQKFTLYPSYRYYDQTAADYFGPYEEHLSTEEFYTSDYDLSEYTANQYGIGMKYTDIFTNFHLWHLGLKSVDLRYYHYQRNSGLTSDLVSGGLNFILEK